MKVSKMYISKLRMFATNINATNTVFVRNVNNLNSVIMTGDSKVKMTADMYARLSSISKTISVLMDEYAKGNFYEVANTLTNDAYNQLAMRLGSIALDAGKYPEYEAIRTMITLGLRGMYQGILQYTNLVDTQARLEMCEQQEAILYDPVKLQEWINKLRGRAGPIFPESNVRVIKATLKPEYAEYIKLYGYPEGGVFDPDKLNTVLNRLGVYYKNPK